MPLKKMKNEDWENIKYKMPSDQEIVYLAAWPL